MQKSSEDAATQRLTDTSKYTGSHKERFDESGKGKGKEGREYLHDNDGYVGGYKGKGTYDDKMKESWSNWRKGDKEWLITIFTKQLHFFLIQIRFKWF